VFFRHLVSPIRDLGGGFVPILADIEYNMKMLADGEADTLKMLDQLYNGTETVPKMQTFDSIRGLVHRS
jgi:hypothetical protein